WFNGALVLDRHDILFRTRARPNIQFHQFLIAPYIGSGSPVDQYMWIDDLTVATGEIASVPNPAPNPVASIAVSPANSNLQVGATQQLTATLKDAAGNPPVWRPITWASSNPPLATVIAGGLVK